MKLIKNNKFTSCIILGMLISMCIPKDIPIFSRLSLGFILGVCCYIEFLLLFFIFKFIQNLFIEKMGTSEKAEAITECKPRKFLLPVSHTINESKSSNPKFSRALEGYVKRPNSEQNINIDIYNKEKEKTKNIDIAPLLGYTPNYEDLSEEQLRTYLTIETKLSNGKFVDVGESRSYIFLFAEKAFEQAKESQNIDRLLQTLELLYSLYSQDEIFFRYFNSWLADCLVLKKEYQKAINLYKKENEIIKIWSLKYSLRLPIEAQELFSVSRKTYFTSFVAGKQQKLKFHVNKLLNEKSIDFLQEIGNKYRKEKKEDYCLFVSTSASFHFNNYNKDIVFINFYSIPEISSFAKNIAREAENKLRTEMGVPKVGEGWVSETELYYKIKEFLSPKEVVHNYRAKWLGRQHLDIFIPELNIAFEYQGLQHSKPVDFFGGEEAFNKNKLRDAKKKEICKRENICLIEVFPDYDFDYIKNLLNKHF